LRHPSRGGHDRADATPSTSREQSRQPPWPGDGRTRCHAPSPQFPVRGDDEPATR
jgi:hypothetical protein